MKEYDHDTPVKILYEERKKRKSKDVRENIILSGTIENRIVLKPVQTKVDRLFLIHL